MVKDAEKKKKLTVADLKDKLNEDQLDLSLCTLDTVPVKEIVIFFKLCLVEIIFKLRLHFKLELANKVRKINLSFNSLVRLPVTILFHINCNFWYFQKKMLFVDKRTISSSFRELSTLTWARIN